jgi:hypothetical protein
MSFTRVFAALGMILALVAPAFAQQSSGGGVEVETMAPAPTPPFSVIRPEAPGSEPTRSLDSYFPGTFGDPTVIYDPAFIEPFTKETETGRMGLAGWTSPVGVVTGDGPMNTRQPGWLSFGFAITWGGPPRNAKTATPAPPSVPR